MIEITTKPDGSAVIEVSTHTRWIPKKGETFFVPDTARKSKPVIEYDWSGSTTDDELLKDGMVFKTWAEAIEHRQFLRAVSRLAESLSR